MQFVSRQQEGIDKITIWSRYGLGPFLNTPLPDCSHSFLAL